MRRKLAEREEIKKLGKELLKSNRGWAMPLAIMIILVTALLSGALFAYAMTDMKAVKMDETREKAKYLARSGAEAVIKDWMNADISARPVGNIETVYHMKDGTFKRSSELSTAQKSNDAVGKVDVKVSNLSDGSSKFEASAVVDGITQKVKATTSPYITGAAAGWYKPGEYEYLFFWDRDCMNINTDNGDIQYINVNSLLLGKIKAAIHCYSAKGAVEAIYSDPLTFDDKKNSDDTYNQNAAYIAESLFFRGPIKFYIEGRTSNNDPTNALVASAQTICFDGEIDLSNKKFLGSQYTYKTIILDVPDGLGYKLSGKTGVYGKVYFSKGATVHTDFGGWSEKTIVNSATAFYFRKKYDEEGILHGFDLLEWYLYMKNPNSDEWKNKKIKYYADDMIPADFSKPVPKTHIQIIWDQ